MVAESSITPRLNALNAVAAAQTGTYSRNNVRFSSTTPVADTVTLSHQAANAAPQFGRLSTWAKGLLLTTILGITAPSCQPDPIDPIENPTTKGFNDLIVKKSGIITTQLTSDGIQSTLTLKSPSGTTAAALKPYLGNADVTTSYVDGDGLTKPFYGKGKTALDANGNFTLSVTGFALTKGGSAAFPTIATLTDGNGAKVTINLNDVAAAGQLVEPTKAYQYFNAPFAISKAAQQTFFFKEIFPDALTSYSNTSTDYSAKTFTPTQLRASLSEKLTLQGVSPEKINTYLAGLSNPNFIEATQGDPQLAAAAAYASSLAPSDNVWKTFTDDATPRAILKFDPTLKVVMSTSPGTDRNGKDAWIIRINPSIFTNTDPRVLAIYLLSDEFTEIGAIGSNKVGQSAQLGLRDLMLATLLKSLPLSERNALASQVNPALRALIVSPLAFLGSGPDLGSRLNAANTTKIYGVGSLYNDDSSYWAAFERATKNYGASTIPTKPFLREFLEFFGMDRNDIPATLDVDDQAFLKKLKAFFSNQYYQAVSDVYYPMFKPNFNP